MPKRSFMSLRMQSQSGRSSIAASVIVAFASIATALNSSAQSDKTSADRAPSVAQDFGKLPLSFEANQGQTDPSAKFLAHGDGYSLFLTDNEAVLAFGKPSNCDSKAQATASKTVPCSATRPASRDIVRMTLGA